MATIVLSAVGTAIGGPLGGMAGALIGNQIDKAVFGGGSREGPRLKELGITTSSYGMPIPRHFGTMRSPGSIIWATDLVESSEKAGGSKGAPSVTTYSYSTSFAVALASRPITRVGRIWADGNLLRGAQGDLKAAGELRIYNGHADQPVDPLIASDKGALTPAFRGLAYCVFEGLQLGNFGNRIPALTFEIVADDGSVSLTHMLTDVGPRLHVDRPLPELAGYSHEGGPIAASLSTIDQIFPVNCDASGSVLAISAADGPYESAITLPGAVADASAEGFGSMSGQLSRRQPDARDTPDALRYYDTGRDFQAGLQRADGRARIGRSSTMEFPGALAANDARDLVNQAAERAAWATDRLSWRIAELDPSLAPGKVVRVPGKRGLWRIEDWEWRATGVELELCKLPFGPSRSTPADAGESLSAPDLTIAPTELLAFEIPWDGLGMDGQRQVIVAASSKTAGWAGAALYADNAGALAPLGGSGRKRSVIGHLVANLPPSSPHVIDRMNVIEVELVSDDFILTDADPSALAIGANRAWIDGEIVQFGKARRVFGSRWQISQLLRGRGGTEPASLSAHASGCGFALLDGNTTTPDTVELGQASAIAATGLGDPQPVRTTIADPGRTLKPLAPVHPRITHESDGSVMVSWTRRARGAWAWSDQVDVPLNEQAEKYAVGIGSTASPDAMWEVTASLVSISASQWAQHSGKPIWVRQVGSWSSSDALLLTIID